MCKRIFIGVLCLVLLVSVFVLPANAEVFTYQDYISDMQVDGDIKTVELTFDEAFAENVWIALYCYEDKSTNRVDRGPLEFYAGCYEDEPHTAIYDIRFGLFGEDSILSTDGIPDGTMFEFSFVINGVDPVVGGTYAGIDGHPLGYVHYYSSDSDGEYVYLGNKLLDAEFVLGNYIPSVRFSFFGDFDTEGIDGFGDSDEYDGVSFTAGIDQLTFKYDGDYFIFCEDIKMTMTIEQFLDSDLSESEKLMGEMRDQLALQGKKLDEITGKVENIENKLDDQWNSEIDSNKPNTPTVPGGDSVDSALNKQEEALRNEAQAGLDKGKEIQDSALSVLANYVSSFGVLTKLFDTFANIPFVSGLLVVSVALGIFGMLLNFAGDVRGAYDRKVRREQAEERRKQAEVRRYQRYRNRR